MSLKNEILFELLNSDDYISGEELAEKYNKSRAGVWKAIKALIRDGYNIEGITNKGYKLIDDRNLVSAQSIKKHLKSDIDVLYYPSVDSTNNLCKKLLADGRKGCFLVVANEQTAGRGRQGKSFYSPADTGIYFSLVTRPNLPLQNAVTATTAAAVCVCKAIETLTDKKPEIKWVNDVFVDGGKICGILTEAITNFEENIVESVIVGIGINVNTSEFPVELTEAGCLNANVNRSELVAKICDELMSVADGDCKGFIDYYRHHSMVLGREIRFIQNGVVTSATAIAIDETGGLEVELKDKSRTVLRSGEISLRFN